MDPKKDITAELDLPGLLAKRCETVESQEEAAARLVTGKAQHFTFLWLGAGAVALVAACVTPVMPERDPWGMFMLGVYVFLWAALSVAAFFPALTVRRLQDKANALSRQVKELDVKIEFCHQVLDEAKRVKVRKYAEAWVEKQSSTASEAGSAAPAQPSS
jgi:hypothetical protein